MTALAAAYDAHEKDGKLIAYPIAANTTIFKGALVGLLGGYAVPASDTAGMTFLGVAHETKVNTAATNLGGGLGPAGAAGALVVRVEKAGTFHYSKTAAVGADLSQPAYVVDDNTVSVAATSHNIPCGYVAEVPDGAHLRVRINRSVQ